MTPELPIALLIDVEPDPRDVDPDAPADWLGFEAAVATMEAWRPRLRSAGGEPGRFTWFLRMDAQVARVHGAPEWVAIRYREELAALERSGDALGIHPHAWRWDDARRTWVSDFGDAAWVERCVRESFAAYERAFGRPCRLHRFGDRWLDERTVALLEELGVTHDLTIEPGLGPSTVGFDGEHTGALPDYRDAPRRPFRPERGDFLRPGAGADARALRMLPVTTVRQAWSARALRDGERAERLVAPDAAVEGRLESADGSWISGWAWDPGRPDAPCAVDLEIDGALRATVAADGFRPDLAADGKGDGAHGFVFYVPDALRDGRARELRARVAGSDRDLPGSPLGVRWPAGVARHDWRTLNLAIPPAQFRAFLEHLLDHERPEMLVIVVRTDAFAKAPDRDHVEHNLAYLVALRSTRSATCFAEATALSSRGMPGFA